MKETLMILFVWFVALGLYAEILDVNDPRYAWMDEVIERQFAAYKRTGITKQMVDKTQSADHTFNRFKIVSSKVYGPASGVKNTLEEIVRRYPVPDVDFLYQIGGDGIMQEFPFPGPIFTSSKRKGIKNAILYHSWLMCPFGWETFSKRIENYSSQLPWDLKINKAFWRGKPSDIKYDERLWEKVPRIKVCHLSFLHPQLIDAGLVCEAPRNQILQKLSAQGMNFLKPFETEYEHMKYKYQICLDGNTCTYPGSEWRFLSNCTVFKHDSTDEMWFYSQLKPWVHYVPVQTDLSDLIEKLEWARSHDEEARIIAENGQRFMRENAFPDHLFLYCYKVLLKYAQLQKFKPSPG